MLPEEIVHGAAPRRAYVKRVDVAQAGANISYGRDTHDTYYKIMADDDVYAMWQKQLQQEEDTHNRQLELQRSRRELLGLPADFDNERPF